MGLISKIVKNSQQPQKSAESAAQIPQEASPLAAPAPAVSMVVAAARKVPRVPGEKLAIAELAAPREPDEIGPCPTCGCPLAWESIYRDGVKKCEQCHPAPSRRIVGERWAIVTAGVEVLPGGEIRGDPAPSHSWVPLRDCWRHAAAERDRLEGEAAALVRSDSGEREAV
jgi:hypothetical protein